MVRKIVLILLVLVLPSFVYGGSKSENNFYLGYRNFDKLRNQTWQAEDSFFVQFNFLKLQTCNFLYGFDMGGSWFKVTTTDTYKGGYYIDAGIPVVVRLLPRRFKIDIFVSPGAYYVNTKFDESVGARLNFGSTLRFFIDKRHSFGVTVFQTVTTGRAGGFNAGISFGF